MTEQLAMYGQIITTLGCSYDIMAARKSWQIITNDE